MWTGRLRRALAVAAVLCAGLSDLAPAAELGAEDMKELEGLLFELNFDPGPIDGRYDARTRTAIELYQGFALLPIDGQPSPALLAELRGLVEAVREVRAAEAQAQSQAQAEPETPKASEATETASSEGAAELPAPQSAPAAAAQAESTARAPAEPAAAPEPEPKSEPAPAQVAKAKPAELLPQPQDQTQPQADSKPQALKPQALNPQALNPQASRPQVPKPQAPKPQTAAQTPETGAEPAVPPTDRGAAALAAKPAPGRFNFDTMITRLVTENGASEKTSPGPSSGGQTGGGAGNFKGAEIAAAGTQTALRVPASQVAALDGYDAFKKGYAAASQGEWDLAIEYYTRAIEGGDLPLDHLATAFFNRANAHSSKKHLNYAIADYNAAIVNKPDFPGAYYNRGFALEEKGERDRAAEDFRKAEALGLRRLGVRSPDIAPPRL